MNSGLLPRSGHGSASGFGLGLGGAKEMLNSMEGEEQTTTRGRVRRRALGEVIEHRGRERSEEDNADRDITISLAELRWPNCGPKPKVRFSPLCRELSSRFLLEMRKEDWSGWTVDSYLLTRGQIY